MPLRLGVRGPKEELKPSWAALVTATRPRGRVPHRGRGHAAGQDSTQAERQLWVCLANRLNQVFCPLNVMRVTVRGPRGIATLRFLGGRGGWISVSAAPAFGKSVNLKDKKGPRLKAPKAAVTAHFWTEHS